MVVVIAAEGYPEHPVKGDKIKIGDSERTTVAASGPAGLAPGTGGAEPAGAYLLHAGTAQDGAGNLLSAGGRVLNVVGTGADVATARGAAYELAATVSMRGGWYRHDIAARL
jgi:phosphoribosylamine--glycine ligase